MPGTSTSPRTGSQDPYWLAQIAKHNAVYIPGGISALQGRYPDRAVAFETRNAGHIWSAKDARGVRHILLRY